MMQNTSQDEPAPYDQYFTLKYIAYTFARHFHPSRHDSHSPWTPTTAEAQAQHAINQLLRPPQHELYLLRERQRIEAELFNPASSIDWLRY